MTAPVVPIVMVPGPELTDTEMRAALETMRPDELASLIHAVYDAAGGLH